MRFPQQYVLKAQLPTGLTAITGAAPQTVAGNQLDSGNVGQSLAARVSCAITTNTLTIAAQWQVLDDDGSTWRNAVDQTNSSDTVLQTGTGTLVTKDFYIVAPAGILAGSRFVRLLLTSGTGSGGGAGVDSASVEYDYRAPVNTLGS
jgi:hypothetical protein